MAIRPPFNYHGGKYYLWKRIIQFRPPCDAYIEPFLGAGSVLLNIPKHRAEIASDLNSEIIIFWKYLQANCDSLMVQLSSLKYYEDTFRNCDELPIHLRAFVRHKMSRGGMGKAYGWSERLRGGQPEYLNKWEEGIRRLPLVAERIKNVVFLNEDAISVVERMATPTSLVYCDPPYMHETRESTSVYAHEMSEAQHYKLLETLNSVPGNIFLSGRNTDLYEKMTKGWIKLVFDYVSHASQSAWKPVTEECLWMRFESKRKQLI